MSSLTMENPLSLSPSPKVQLARNLQDVQDCIQELKKEFEENGIPINDDNQTLHRFCAKLEFLLQAGLKARTGLLGGKKDYWNFFCDCLTSVKGLSDGIKFVKSLSELKTSLGRGRALIRFGLVHQRLADTIQQCVFNSKITQDWYQPQALWLQQNQTSVLINNLYDLNDLQFDLSPRGYDLDTAWPTFARKTFGSQQLWSAPSRSISINSLAGTQENLASSFTPSLVREQDVENLKQDLNDMENDKLSLESQIEQLQNAKQDAEEKAKKLESQLHDLQIAYSNFQVRYEKVATELQTKENSWVEKEKMLKAQIHQANRSLTDIRCTDASNFDITELRLKLLARDKTVAAQQIEMKAIRLELDSKTKTEAQKTRLVELLDRKIDHIENCNSKLEAKVKELELAVVDAKKASASSDASVKEAVDADVKRVKNEQAETEINNLKKKLETTEDAYVDIKKKLTDSEKLNDELRDSNNQFRTMLHSMEEKGIKIAKMAKEKLTSYSDANKQLKADMATLSKSMTDLQLAGVAGSGTSPEGEGAPSDVQALRKENEELKQDLASAQGNLTQVQASKEGLETKIKNMEGQEQLLQQQQKGLEQKVEQQQTSADKLKEELTGLKTAVTQLETADSPGGQDKVPIESKVKAVMEEKMFLQASLRSAEATSVEFSKQVETAQHQIEDMESLTTQLQLENTELKTVISQMEVRHADLGSKVEKLEMDLQSRQAEFPILNEELLSSKHKYQQLQDKVNELENILYNKEETIKDLSCTKEGVDKEFSSIQFKLVEVLQQREELQERVKQLESKEGAAVKEAEEAHSSSEIFIKEIDSVNFERDKLKETVASLTEESQNWKDKCIELEDNLSRSVEEKLLALRDHLKQEQEARQTLETDLEHIRKLHHDNEQRIKVILEKRDTDQKEHEMKIKKMEDEAQALLQEKGNLNEEVSKVTQEKTDMERSRDNFQNETARLQCEVDKAISDVSQLKQEMESLKTLLSKAEEHSQDTNYSNQTLKEEIEKQYETIKALKGELSNSQSALKSVESELGETKCALNSRESDVEQLRTEVTLAGRDKDTLSCKLTESFKNVTELNQELMELKNKSMCITENVQQTLTEKHDLNEKMLLVAQEKTKLEDVISELQNVKGSQEQQIVHLQGELITKSQEVVLAKENYADIVSELESTKQKLSETLDSLNTTQDAMEKEMSALRFQLSSEQMQFQDKMKNIETQDSNISEMAQQMAAQESVIESLELEVEHMKRQRDIDQEQQRIELEDLRQMVGNREEECRVLSSDLKRTSTLLDEERNLVLKFKNDLTEQLKAREKEQEFGEKENQLLRSDNLDLKKKLIRLVKDKEMLWLKTDKLEYVQKLLAASKWMEDGEVTHCLGCRAEFSFRLRKHHCRLCGKIYCHNCSSHFIMTPHSSKKERVCNECFILQNQVKSPLSRDPSPVADEDGEGFQEGRGYSWSQSGTSEGDTEEDGISSLEVSHERNDDSVNAYDTCRSDKLPLPHSSNTAGPTSDVRGANDQETSQNTEKTLPDTYTCTTQTAESDDENIPASVADEPVKFIVGSENSSRVNVHYESVGLEQDMPEESSVANSSSQRLAVQDNGDDQAGGEAVSDVYARETDEYKLASGQAGANQSVKFDDDGFDLITDDEIARSIHDPNPDPNMYGCPTMTLVDIGPDGHESPDDLWVLPGKVYSVPVEINLTGVELAWEFTTEHKNIYFSVVYKEDDLVPNDQVEVLIPTCKCNSHKHSVQGELTARKTGVYSLLFDNSVSRFTSKKLNYKLSVRLPETGD